MTPLWIYSFMIACFSLFITCLLFWRWRKSKDHSLLYWGSGFLFYAASNFFSSLFIAGVFPEQGVVYVLLHFIRQSLVSLFFIAVYLGIAVLVTKKRFWRFTFPLFFLFLQLIVTGYYDLVRSMILFAENLHIFLFDIPFNVVISVLFMRYYLISSRRFSLLQSLAWSGYLILVSIGFGIEFSPLFYTISLVPMLLMLTGFIDYYRRPLTEHILEIMPKIEPGSIDEKPIYVLKPGSVNLVTEQKPNKSFDMFIDNVMHKVYGLAISRKNPDLILKEYGLKSTPLIWLTRIETEKTYLHPAELEQLTFAVTDFIDKVGDKRSVVLVDGLEYLATQNEFSKVLHAVTMMKDKISQSNSSLILPLDPGSFSERDFTMLQKELV